MTPVLTVGASSAGSPTSRELRPLPDSNPGFTELQNTYIYKPVGTGWTFRIDDEPLQDAHDAAVAAWIWKPGFYAGEVTGELEAPDGSVVARYLLEVSPDPGKVGRELFNRMLEEIWAEDPSLILGTEPAQTPSGVLDAIDDPLIGFARLRRYGHMFLRGLHAISSQPIQTLHQTRERMPLHQARRADRQTVLAALSKPSALGVLAGQERAFEHYAGNPIQLDIPRATFHLDGAANRCVTALALAVARRIARIRREMRALSEGDERSETRTALAPRWPVRERVLISLEDRLKAALKRPPFSSVSRAEVTGSGLNAVAAHPLYSRASAVAWRILRPGLAGPPSEERLWMSPTWEIYERWCFVRLRAALRALRPELEWQRIPPRSSNALGGWKGQGDRTTLELLLQPVFSAWDHSHGKARRSLSAEFRPDLILTRSDEPAKLVVLDAKYRVQRSSILEAMRSAHIYRDALRFRDSRPELSLLLVPGSSSAPWLEEPQFQAEHGVGVAVLGPDGSGESAALADLLQRF
jgi:hypothetical protein